jgi:hypothetical protein
VQQSVEFCSWLSSPSVTLPIYGKAEGGAVDGTSLKNRDVPFR